LFRRLSVQLSLGRMLSSRARLCFAGRWESTGEADKCNRGSSVILHSPVKNRRKSPTCFGEEAINLARRMHISPPQPSTTFGHISQRQMIAGSRAQKKPKSLWSAPFVWQKIETIPTTNDTAAAPITLPKDSSASN